jgi:hypothetical protein
MSVDAILPELAARVRGVCDGVFQSHPEALLQAARDACANEGGDG